jgi:hypothetical protein
VARRAELGWEGIGSTFMSGGSSWRILPREDDELAKWLEQRWVGKRGHG